MTSPASRRPPSSGSERRVADALERGELVSLRRPVAEDRDEWVALRESCLEHLLPWEPHQKVKGERERWASFFSTANTDDRQRFMICENATGVMVGYVGLNDIRHGVMQSCNAGYWIAERFTRKGYMTEGLRLAVRHAFRTLTLHRVEAGIQPHNTASIGVVKKLGFRYEGTALRLLEINGKWSDHERWAITAEEWHEAKAPRTIKPQPPASTRTPRTRR
jgi:[ribosomal protein S5]-alanine N-acetyltransferase